MKVSTRSLVLMKPIAFACAAMLSIGVAHAAEEHALDACIQKFVDHNLSDYDGKISVEKSNVDYPTPLALSSSSYRVIVSAHGKTSGAALASATCIVDRRGKVLSLTMDHAMAGRKSDSPLLVATTAK